VPIHNIFEAHEIGPVLSLSAALAGRMLGGPLARALGALRAPGAQGTPRARWAARTVPATLAVIAAVLAGYVAMLGWSAAHPQARVSNAGLTAWLSRHGLRSGLAPYWEGSDVTVNSGGAITMLAIEPRGRHGALVAQRWETDVALGDQRTHSANFIVVTPERLVTRKAVLATFGRPARTYQYGNDTILVWRHNLLPTLAAQPPARL
jgi:hypothetical protein